VRLRLIFATEILLLNSGRVVLEGWNAWLPRKEENSLFAVGCDLLGVAGVKLDPVLVLELLCVLELQANNRPLFLLVSPVPKRDRLRLIVTKGGEVVVVCRDIYGLHTVRMRIQVGADGSAAHRVPHYEHRVIPAICSHDPALVIGAGCCRDAVAVTLKESLGLGAVVVNHTSVCRAEEDLVSLGSSEVVHSLVDVLVEADHILKIL